MTRLADTGQIYVTLGAALAYHEALTEEHREATSSARVADARGLEASRRELTELLLDARATESAGRWRVRGGIGLTALTAREGPLVVVTSVTVHHVKRST